MLIGELADVVGVPRQTIRFYERRGLLPAPRRAPNGYRVYGEEAVARVRFVRAAQSAGLTLAEIAGVVALRAGGQSPCAHATALLSRKAEAVRARRRELESLERQLDALVRRSADLDAADCRDADVCHVLAVP